VTAATEPVNADDALTTARRLMADGSCLAAVEVLTQANRRQANPAVEALLVDARHRAFSELPQERSDAPWPPPVPDVFAGVTGVPEITAGELTVERLGAGLQHHGSLLVRGLLAPEVCAMVTDEIARAFRDADATSAGHPAPGRAPAYVPFEPSAGYDFGLIERQFFRFGAVLAVEAPHALFMVIEALGQSRVTQVIGAYFGEPPALSAKKTSLRRAEPGAQTEWHQDGAFLGDGTRTVNVWTALTPCGVDAPSVDVFARPFADIVATGTDGARYDWSVSAEEAERAGTSDVVRPVFAAGDALLFNQLTLHRTGVSPEMTRDRYALESWFFAPSTYPHEQVPIAF
jgi:Phytanoyl-CoA dioxygenase (PhyH)